MWIRLILSVLLAALANGQNAAQKRSVARQLASVRRQITGAKPAPVAMTVVLSCGAISVPALGQMIETAAHAGGVTPALVREVARQESGFRPCAVSSKGAEGLMQLMPATQASLGVGNPFDPEESLTAGARLLGELLSRYNGNVALALSAYNAGPSRVDAANGIPAIAETRNYVAQILSRLIE